MALLFLGPGSPLRSRSLETFHLGGAENALIPEILLQVESGLSYSFKEKALLLEALTHSSFSNEKANGEGRNEILPDNERLEFLGDAVIGLVVGERLMSLFPEACEGKLSRWRSQLVSRKTLGSLASEVGMGGWILLGRGERRTGGADKRSILAGVFESVVGALYQDGGLKPCQNFLLKVYEPLFANLTEDDHLSRKQIDQKTFLQEFTQSKFRSVPVYRLAEVWGLEHEKNFRVELEVNGKVVAEGLGRSKKEAEQEAASKALEILGV